MMLAPGGLAVLMFEDQNVLAVQVIEKAAGVAGMVSIKFVSVCEICLLDWLQWILQEMM